MNLFKTRFYLKSGDGRERDLYKETDASILSGAYLDVFL